jgi:hypothetical protein
MTREEWIAYGMAKKWCTYITCVTHEGPRDIDKFVDDEDACWFVLELLDNE